MNKQQLASRIWESANKMRSKIEANEYKDYILGFIFYKFLSEKEEEYLRKLGVADEDMEQITEENDEETVNHTRKNIGYFISYENLFSTWLKMGKDFSVDNVRTALSAFSRLIGNEHKKVFDKIFNTLDTGLSKLGDSSGTQTKAIRDLIYLIKDIPMDGRQGYDVLGFIYEYLINMFAANAGKKAGEFYTPHEVSLLMSEIVAEHLKDRDEIKIYDPTSGSGSLLINIGHSVSRRIGNSRKIKYYAQELKENTYNLTRMNLVMRGILPDNIVTRNGDTLEEDWPYFDETNPIETYNPLYVDAVVSNPPYSQAWDPTNKETDPRYARYGIAPKSKADYAFLLHDLYHIKNDGIMTIVLPHGVLFRGGEEGEIRKNLIENDHIDTIIGLPANIFFGTGIPTIIMVLKQKRERNDVLIIDASKGFMKAGKNNKLRASDIKKIVDAVTGRKNIDKYSKVVSKEEIRSNDYNLNIPRYVDSSEAAESWDIYASMFGGIPKNEIDELKKYWEAFPGLKSELFENSGSPYVSLKCSDVKSAVMNCRDIVVYKDNYRNLFKGLEDLLYHELVEEAANVNIPMGEEKISDYIFGLFDKVQLVDVYQAYQALDDEWQTTAVDLEIIQSEGFEAVRAVDPLMVTKKKNGKDEEVQDGWMGRVIPFALVQSILLKDMTDAIKADENRLSEIVSEYEEVLESLSEEEKGEDVVNEEGNAWVNKEVNKRAKAINKEDATEFELKILQVDSLIAEEKNLKTRIKKANDELADKTKETVENLSDEDARALLKEKWIVPLCERINKLPDDVIGELVTRVTDLAAKYEVTYTELEAEIKEAEQSLAAMLDELVGDEYDMKGLSEFKSLLLGD